MEPLVASSASAVIRPAITGTVANELSAVLREGRVLAGEVMARNGDGTLLLALGRHRVPAETNLRLDPGQRFLLRVMRNGGELELAILGGVDAKDDSLLDALRQVVGKDRPIGELLADLAARVRAELARPGGELSKLGELLARLEAHVLGAGDGGEELATLFRTSGLRYEVALLAAARSGGAAALLDRLRGNLKGELLRAMAELPEGPAREAVARALAGLEAEQLLNLARQRAGEPMVWSFPFPDGSAVPGWTTARLTVFARNEDEGGADDGEPESQRFQLGVSFTNLGPVRADFVLSKERLAVRLLVSREDLAERLMSDFGELAQRLGGDRAVSLFARVGTAAEVGAAERPLDIRFLREHHLMDVRG